MRAIAAAFLALSLGVAQARAEAPDCSTYGDLAGSGAPLPHVADALAPGSRLAILAIGSASILGPQADGPLTRPGPRTTPPPAQEPERSASDKSFTEQMARALQASLPGLTVDVTVRGGRGLTASDQLQLLRTALAESKYQLVIWQTGTVEAVRNLPPSDFAQTLADGATLIEQADANLLLIDPQFSRFLQTNSNIEPYEEALQQVGAFPGVLLFHRFDLMRAWANDGVIDLERAPKQERIRVVELLHQCLGQQLARTLLANAHPHTD